MSRRHRVQRALTGLMLAGLAGACATDPDASPPLASGATLILDKPVEIPAEARATWFQDGELASYRRPRPATYCRLELHRHADTARTVAPGRFTVAWVREDFQTAATPGSVQVAGLRIAAGASPGNDPISVANELVMGLESAKQPAVARLACGKHRPTGPHLPPTLKEIDGALGRYGRLDTTAARAD